MANKNMVAEAEEQDSAVAPAKSGTLRRLLAKRRSDRKGALGSTEMVQLIGVILLIALLAGGTFVYLRFIRGSSENSVVQRNVDEVAKLGDSFWQNYSADVDGRRKIDLYRFCEFANNQLAEDDLNLRTLQITDADGGATVNAVLTAAQVASASDIGMAGIAEAASRTASEATCSDGSNMNTAFHDIHAGDERGTSVGLDAHNTALENAGLLSTRSVWMAQYGNGASSLNTGTPAADAYCENTATSVRTTVAPSTATAASAITGPGGRSGACLTGETFTGYVAARGHVFAPNGADTTYAASGGSAATGVEVLVFGGMAPSGDSFCLIKVFDAANADQIGEYRVSRLSTPEFEFATCLEGFQADGPNEPRRGGNWPEPQQ